jgi:hypothetical protein
VTGVKNDHVTLEWGASDNKGKQHEGTRCEAFDDSRFCPVAKAPRKPISQCQCVEWLQ